MNELNICIKDELDGSVSIKVLPEGANKLQGRAKNLVTFILAMLDQIPQKVRDDIFDGAQIRANIEFAVKPRRLI